MPSNDTEDQKLAAQANELYWRSRRSVNQIAEDLDLSKSRLYGLVEALPADMACPDCGAGLVFPNRTAMDKGFVSCPECGLEGTGEELSKSDAAEEAHEDISRSTGSDSSDAVAAPARLGSKRILWGSALLGIAAGLYLATRRRRS